jgi:RNA polymerase sigma factor (sigma-70 family)
MKNVTFSETTEQGSQFGVGRDSMTDMASSGPCIDECSCSRIYGTSCQFFKSHGVNYMDAEDLAVEASLRWIKQVDAGEIASTAWFNLVCRNLLIDWFRQSQRHRRLLQAYAESAPHEEVREDVIVSFAEQVESLASLDQVILHAHYVEGRTSREIAEALSLSVDCVKQRLHRARARLNLLLESKQH